MGTRASVIFTEKNQPVCAIYRQYDGYPEGLGAELESIIKAGKFSTGLGSDRTLGSHFNGAGCMFATVIAKLKEEAGNVYMCNPNEVGDQFEDYVYTVNEKGEISNKRMY
jgi:hypothetical protein